MENNGKLMELEEVKGRERFLVGVVEELEGMVQKYERERVESEAYKRSVSSPVSTKCTTANSETNLQEELDTKTKQLLIIKS